MANRVRYYISAGDDRPVVKSVPVTICTQPTNDLVSIEQPHDEPRRAKAPIRRPVGRIVKVLRKPSVSEHP